MLHRKAILDLKSLAQWIISTSFLIGCGGKTCWGVVKQPAQIQLWLQVDNNSKFIRFFKQRQLTAAGRAKLRERVAIGHSLNCALPTNAATYLQVMVC